MEDWFEASRTQQLIDFVVCSKVFSVRAVAHGFRKDGVAVVVIGNHQVLVALAGCGWESAGEVNVQPLFQFDVNDSCIEEVRLISFRKWMVIIFSGVVGVFG